jgi:branched-chain amino acid transport system ATP-binding protein
MYLPVAKECLLALSGLEVAFQPGHHLQSIDLVVNSGEIVVVLGSTASGKTALLKSIYGVLPIQRGSIEVGGMELRPSPERARRSGIGYIRSDGGIFTGLTVEENLAIAGTGLSNDEFNKRLDETMTKFAWFGERRRQRAETLSGGEQKLLSIAMCLLNSPRIILADEPTRGLSTPSSMFVMDVLIERKMLGDAVLVSEERVQEVCKVADRFYALRAGRIVGGGGMTNLTDEVMHQIYL